MNILRVGVSSNRFFPDQLFIINFSIRLIKGVNVATAVPNTFKTQKNVSAAWKLTPVLKL